MNIKNKLELYIKNNPLFLNKLSTNTLESIYNDLNLNCNRYYIFSDGNCKQNGKKNARGAFSVYCENNHLFNTTTEIKDEPTNNKAELSGILHIFKTLYIHINHIPKNEIIICTDSLYSIKCVTEWSHSWIQNNWKKKDGHPVKNKELIAKILKYYNFLIKHGYKIDFKHIKSHQPEPKQDSLDYFYWLGNKRVDQQINDYLK